MFLLTYFHIWFLASLLTCFISLFAYLLAYLPPCFLASLPNYIFSYLLTCLLTYLLTYLLTCWFVYLLTCLLAHFLLTSCLLFGCLHIEVHLLLLNLYRFVSVYLVLYNSNILFGRINFVVFSLVYLVWQISYNVPKLQISSVDLVWNTSLAAPGALAHRLQRRTAQFIQNSR